MNITQSAKCQIKQMQNVPFGFYNVRPIFQTGSGRSLSVLPLVVAAHLHTLENYLLLFSTFLLFDMPLSKQFQSVFLTVAGVSILKNNCPHSGHALGILWDFILLV